MMNSGRSMSAQLAFPLAAVLSGFASGVSNIVPGGGIILPGLFFGIAMAFAVHHTIEAVSPVLGAVLILLSTFGFWVACITGLLTFRLTGGRNDFVSGSIAGMFAGGAGASLTAFGLAISSAYFPLMRVVIVMTLAGAAFGAVVFPVLIYLHDIGHLPHPLDFILEFVMWQVGVASVVPLSMKVQANSQQ